MQSAAFELGDWVSVTDVDLRYTLSVPADWQWLDVAFRDQSRLLAEVMDRQVYVRRALRPLGNAADDLDITGLAVGSQTLEIDEALPFVVVGRSAPTPKRLEKAAAQVTAVSDGIRAGAFTADPSPMRCGSCPFRDICPDAAR